MKSPHSFLLILILFLIFFNPPLTTALGSGGTIAVTTTTVCGISAAAKTNQNIQCRRRNDTITHTILPTIPFSSISGGRNFFCGINSGGYVMYCWDDVSFKPERIYFNHSATLENIAVGDDHVCGIVRGSGAVECWRGDRGFEDINRRDRFTGITSGSGFSCGVLKGSNQVRCWGSNPIGEVIARLFGEMAMVNVVAGGEHVCGFNSTGVVVCIGRHGAGQLDVPRNSGAEYLSLALGGNYSCGIRRMDNSVVCWGGGGRDSDAAVAGISYEIIASGKDFVCGLLSKNVSVMCWGPGWGNGTASGVKVVLTDILPGACVQSCSCGVYYRSDILCNGSGIICKPCLITPPPAPARLLHIE